MSPSTFLHRINSIMSGCLISITAILAPSRLPPCVIIDDTLLSVFNTLIGPHAIPWVDLILEPCGLIFDNANPVPPPYFCTIAVSVADDIISSILSSNGSTKHADIVPLMPAFINVGLLGKQYVFFNI